MNKQILERIEWVKEHCKEPVIVLRNEEIDFVEYAVKKIEKYEAQWLDRVMDPLEPLKVSCALDSELFKLQYRKEHNPESINTLDYTIIAVLKKYLEEVEE